MYEGFAACGGSAGAGGGKRRGLIRGGWTSYNQTLAAKVCNGPITAAD